jgi:K(+)-stimulated pyrophosphate-energized sodium pump
MASEYLIFAVACGAIAVIYGLVSRAWILRQDPGNPRMQQIAQAIQEGAGAYLGRPRKPTTSPGATRNDTSWMAVTGP